MPQPKKVVAVDFDGTVVRHEYPEVGEEVPGAVEGLQWLVNNDYKIILWTMRSGEYLQAAEDWFKEREIPLWGINKNPTQHEWTDSPKAYAPIYIDDAALGCPLYRPLDGKRPYVAWADILYWFEYEMEGG